MKDCTVFNFDSPIGGIRLAVMEEILVSVDFISAETRMERLLSTRFGRLALRSGPVDVTPFQAYFDGEIDALTEMSVRCGGTEFQQRVWRALRQIPVGGTVSYKELADEIGRPDAVRAVARANALNPLSLVVPCHRVIGSNGDLTGYAGGIPAKAWLLAHEKG